MTKGSVFDFLGLYGAIISDIAIEFPNDRVQWVRDLNRIFRLLSHQGESVFTIDFPALGKVLDRSLSLGRLTLGDCVNHTGSRHPNSKIPRLFWGLWSRLFDDSGYMRENIDPNVVLYLRTLLYAGKNVQADCSPRYLYETTKEFFNVEANLPPPSPIWDGDGCDLHNSILGQLADLVPIDDDHPLMSSSRHDGRLDLLESIQRVADRVSSELGELKLSDLSFMHGPGAVSDLKGKEYKYSFPTWSPRLDVLFPWDWCGTTALGQGDLSYDTVRPRISETHSVLRRVPKTMKGPRLIAKEPTCHMWIQQSIRLWLQDHMQDTLLVHCLDLKDQSGSQRLALAGSLDGSYATMDLKSASDRISTQLVQRIFRRNYTLLGPLIACRTRYLSNPLDKRYDSLIKLRKFSTQGSALTFPVQSIIFSIVCIGVGRYLNKRMKLKEIARRVRVFGDDIIVPNHWEPFVRTALEILGLKVNMAKTFSAGNFRESCGMDAFQGYDVTPPHVNHPYKESAPQTLASVVATSNNFFAKGFWRAAAWLATTLPARIHRMVRIVRFGSGAFGFTSYSGTAYNTVSRWNKHLQHWENKGIDILSKSQIVKQEAATSLLQYFSVEPDPYFMYESGVAVAGVPVMRHTWVPESSLS